MVVGVRANLGSDRGYHSPQVVIQVEAVDHDRDHDEQQPVEGNFREYEEQLEDDETREDDDQH